MWAYGLPGTLGVVERVSTSSATGDLADVVAHGLTAIAIQAEAAETVLRRDPERAADSLAAIRGSALEALHDVRLLLAALRDDDGCGRAPQPSLDRLPGLIAGARDAGQPVELEVRGESRPLGASVQLAAYRVVQEALAGSVEHAPGTPTAVAVTWAPEELEVAVTDAGHDGRDLGALQERVRVHGGTLTAQELPGGGYRVAAVFRA
jgi:signal transduction histidine kinase